jgi:hypothetical protein
MIVTSIMITSRIIPFCAYAARRSLDNVGDGF